MVNNNCLLSLLLMSEVSIPNQVRTQSVEVNQIALSIMDHVLFHHVTFQVLLKPVDTSLQPLAYLVTVKDEEYQMWGTDDNYIIQVVANKIGVVLI